MGTSINTNLTALGVQRYVNGNQSAVTNAMTRLSTGLRINSAKDDAAGLIIGERMTAQIRGMNVGSRNANDAISLVQTAESSLASMASALQRIRELAVQSANASNSDSDRSTLNSEAKELINEVERISNDTAFNGVKLLDGSFKQQNFQVGANAGQQLQIDKLIDARTTGLGRSSLTLDGASMGQAVTATTAALVSSAGNGVVAQTSVTNATLKTTAGTSPAIEWSANASAKDIAAAINAKAASVGVQATATTTATLSGLTGLTLTGSPPSAAISLSVNGTTVNASISNAADLTALADAINGSVSGVTATFASPPAKDSLKLVAADGSNLELTTFTSGAASLNVKGSAGAATSLVSGGSDSTVVTGNVEVSSTKGAITWANFDATATSSAGGTAALKTVNSMDISSTTGATDALKVIDTALDQVSAARGDLGAKQNRLEMLVANVDVVAENLTAARSRLMDADFAKETAALSRAQILQQAGTAMLAQANALPQQVLQLLKG